jgi:hypothetical protein
MMFDLEAASPVQWAVQVLTLDYLIDGCIDEQRNRIAFHLVNGDARALRVMQARIAPTGALQAPVRSDVPYVLVYGSRLVALIPRDQASTDYALRQNASFRIPIPAEVYAGPYLLRGQVLSPDSKLRVFSGYAAFPMQSVTVTCLAPGARMAPFGVPYLLLIGNHRQMVAAAA